MLHLSVQLSTFLKHLMLYRCQFLFLQEYSQLVEMHLTTGSNAVCVFLQFIFTSCVVYCFDTVVFWN